MINVAVSYGFDGDSRYHLEDIPNDIQLSIFKYKLMKNRDYIQRLLR